MGFSSKHGLRRHSESLRTPPVQAWSPCSPAWCAQQVLSPPSTQSSPTHPPNSLLHLPATPPIPWRPSLQPGRDPTAPGSLPNICIRGRNRAPRLHLRRPNRCLPFLKCLCCRSPPPALPLAQAPPLESLPRPAPASCHRGLSGWWARKSGIGCGHLGPAVPSAMSVAVSPPPRLRLPLGDTQAQAAFSTSANQSGRQSCLACE